MNATEPKLTELRGIMKELMTQKSTEENMKKIRALEVQIKRHEDAEKPKSEEVTKNSE